MSEPLKWTPEMEEEYQMFEADENTLQEFNAAWDYTDILCRLSYLAARQRGVDELKAKDREFRSVLATFDLHYGAEMYTDDGQMQCSACRTDYMHNPIVAIAAKMHDRSNAKDKRIAELEAEVRELRRKLDWWEQQGTAGTPDWYFDPPTAPTGTPTEGREP